MKSSFGWNVLFRGFIVALVLPFFACIGDWFGNNGNVDLSRATWLVAEKVPLSVDNGGVPGIIGDGSVTPLNGLFNLPPGTKVKAQALGGAIDPTGTTIVNDFDGDGILNSDERTTNVWVADYPDVDATVAPPVTMKIAILKNSSGQTDEIVSEINSEDIESTTNEGSESIHQNEVNLRTVQFQDQYKREYEHSQDNELDVKYSLNAKVLVADIGVEAGYRSRNQYSERFLDEATTTKWADKPFKNDIDKEAKTVKSDSASNKARKFRSDKTSKVSTTSLVEANAGYVRAALYIKNRSVNMPVKLSNILCTLMFENARGDLIPVQSFRLKNEDYSNFEVEVYGGEDFGPYVVELPKLNTAEIENAIASGYNPKIYIVDYTMTHVADSNYKSSLLNFTGNNLKIIEENAKGRTSLIKVYGPKFREKFRVAAFDDFSTGDPCVTKTASDLSPGVTLKKALERIACSGVPVEFEDYVLDMSEFASSLDQPRIHIKGIKSLAGIPTKLPCTYQTFAGSDGVSRTACVQKAASTWTDEERRNAGVWAIYSKGKYNALTEYWVDGSNIRIFDPSNIQKAQMVKGVDSIIWAGDYYDIVYISVKDLAKNEENPPYGATPIGSSGSTLSPSAGGSTTNANDYDSSFKLNTRWDLSQLGENPYDPDVKSFFVGQVGFSEKVVLAVTLDSTKYLNPDFGLPESGGSFQYFSNFSYNPIVATKRFNIDQVMDFEISLGFGGTRTDWVHIYKDTDVTDQYKIRKKWIDTSGYTNQTFRICLQMPTLSQVVDPNNSLVNIYIRPALNSAYRRTIWPLKYTEVKKMRGELNVPAKVGDTTVYLAGVYGNIESNDPIYLDGDSYQYKVVSSVPTPLFPQGSYTVVVDTPLKMARIKTTPVSIPGALSAPDVRLIVDNSFVTDWNTQVQASPATDYNAKQNLSLLTGSAVSCSGTSLFHPYGCLGYTPDYRAVNWMGNYNNGVPLWNSWTDAGGFYNFLSGGMFQLTTNSGRSYKTSTLVGDSILSDPGSVVTLSEPITLVQGDTAFVIWQRDTTLQGKFYQISTGAVLSPQTTLNTASIPAGSEFTAKLDNGKVVIIWENNFDLYMTVRNMNTYAIIGSEQKIATRVSKDPEFSIDVALASGRAMVAWSDYNAGHKLVKARIYDLITVTPVAAEFVVQDQFDNGGRFEVRVDGSGGSGTKVLLVWNYNRFGGNAHIYAFKVYDILTGVASAIPGAPNTLWYDLFSEGGTAPPTGYTYAKVSGDRGLVTFRALDGTLYTRVINLTNATMLPASNLIVDTATLAVNPVVVGDKAYILYAKDTSIYLKVVNLPDGQLYSNVALSLGTSAVGSVKKPGTISVIGNTIVAVWENFESSKRTVRGRLVTLSPFAVKGGGEFFLSTTNQGNQSGATAVTYNDRALVTWWSADTAQQVIRGYNLDLLNPGALQFGLNNFFIAPLIERNYTIKAQIVP